jgi:penicillin-binding protein 1C
MIDVSGISGAAPIWHDAMLLAEKGHPIHDFTNPGGLIRATVTYPDGVKTTDLFMPGTVPTFSQTPTPSPTIVDVVTPTPTPVSNPSQPLPAAYCPTSYRFAFAPPPDSEVAVDAGWW